MRPIGIEPAVGQQEPSKFEPGQLINESELMLESRYGDVSAPAQPSFYCLNHSLVRGIDLAL
jgi:hypothetical protein